MEGPSDWWNIKKKVSSVKGHVELVLLHVL